MGRVFADDEYQLGRDQVVVLSTQLWQTRFGSDPAVIGRTIRLGSQPLTVIGVMPPELHDLPVAPAEQQLLSERVPGSGPAPMDRGLQKEPMVTDVQVRRLRRKLMEGKTLASAAAAAAMSERTARTWKDGLLPSQTKQPREWRTQPDPFGDVWDTDVVPLLKADETGRLEAKTIIEVLGQRYPGRYGEPQLRTMQRRVRQWRALQGPPKTAYFQQDAQPGREGGFDFTHGSWG